MKKKSLLFGFLSVFVVLGISSPKIAKAYTNAPSTYVGPVNEKPADIISVDWSTTKNAPNTYWAVHNWNAGGEAGGYAGFQQQPNRRTVHFALWDPISVKEPIKAEYISPTSKPGRFGGEGNGLNVQTEFNWQPNSWYKMTMRNWQEDGHTKFGQWVRDESTKEWKQIAILDFPVANVNFGWGAGMFQEDWAGNGQDVRNARLKNFYSRSVSNKAWNSLNKQKVTTSVTNGSWNGGANSEYVWVEAGGNTRPSITNGQVFSINQPSTPDVGTIDFDITNAKYENGSLDISWKLKKQSTPQFKGKIEIYNNSSMTGIPVKTINNIKSYKYSVKEDCVLFSPTGLYAKIIITDLFDNTVTKTVNLTSETEKSYEGSNFTFDFKGYKDEQFAKLKLDLANFTSKLTVENIKTHYYFNDNYASILVQDKEGKIVFTKDFIGNEVNDALEKDIPLKDGYYLTVKHRESTGRLFITNNDKNLKLNKANTNSYYISKDKLTPVDPEVIPNPNKNPYYGKNFNFAFKGLGDWLFAELNLDLTSNQAKIDIKKGAPHTYFTDSYASILIRDNEGNPIYSKDFIGNKTYEALVTNVNVKPGYFITIKHKEPNINNRLFINNLNNKLELGKGNSINYKITDTGVSKISDSEIPTPDKITYSGTNFKVSFKGYADLTFANMDINLNNKKATINTSNVKGPHNNFSKTYASILIQDSKKQTVYSKNYIGTNTYNQKSEIVPLEEGSIITITHLEYSSRLEIINLENQDKLQKADSVTYQVVNGGLKKIS